VPTALHALLKPAAISQSEFFSWNPALESNTKVLPSGYWVKLPADKVEPFLAAQSRAAEPASVKKMAASKAKGNTSAAKVRGAGAKSSVKPASARAATIVKAKAPSRIAKRPVVKPAPSRLASQ
jgi:hypothetical protein